MPKKNTSNIKPTHFDNESWQLTNSAFELVNWPPLVTSKPTSITSFPVSDKVFALQTTRLSPQQTLALKITPQGFIAPPLSTKGAKSECSAFNAFNLGLHVGDNAARVKQNRDELAVYINDMLASTAKIAQAKDVAPVAESVEIQWLEQVHGDQVVEVSQVDGKALIADASITRAKNIALAIMTADCLPILLSHKSGNEVAAIHGGWRPLAADIIAKTIAKMHSKPMELVAWLGPCISKNAFEVGSEVKAIFLEQGSVFGAAFERQENGKYLADLHLIARLQLQLLGITEISSLTECTYQETSKYYSYRKEQVTGRMATVICRR